MNSFVHDGRYAMVTTGEDALEAKQQRMVAKIVALLAQAESTDFEEEREAFFAKAVRLMAEYSIDDALIWAAGTRDTGRAVATEVVLTAPYVGPKMLLVHQVASGFGCEAVRMPSEGASTAVSIVGFDSDLRLVEGLVASLMVQLSRAMLSAEPASMSSTDRQSFRRSFIVSFAEEVGRRIRAIREDELARRRAAESQAADAGRRAATNGSMSAQPTQADGPSSVAVALVERSEAVQDELRRRHPRLRKAPISTGRSSTGRRHGQVAGRRADLGQERLAARRRLGRGIGE